MPEILAWISHWEIIVVLVIALLLFGTRLPKVARSLGQGVSEFKSGLKGVKKDVESAGSEESGEKD
ncbi:MAG: Sec-independent protein translocase subunit TatA/TatB [Planctomycetota bacterium]|jgi:sec-independent protein translocase protein TatA